MKMNTDQMKILKIQSTYGVTKYIIQILCNTCYMVYLMGYSIMYYKLASVRF